MTEWDSGPAAAEPGDEPLAVGPTGGGGPDVAAAAPSVRGNVAVGVLCGVALSVPVWVGLVGAVRALLT